MIKNFLGMNDYVIKYNLSKEDLIKNIQSKEDLKRDLNSSFEKKMLSKGCDTLFETYTDRVKYYLGKSGCKVPEKLLDFVSELSKEMKQREWVFSDKITSIDILDAGDNIDIYAVVDIDTIPPERFTFNKTALMEGKPNCSKTSYHPGNGLISFINYVIDSIKLPLSGIYIRADIYNDVISGKLPKSCIISCETSETQEGEFLIGFWLHY